MPDRLVFALPGDPATLTGGYLYDARIVAGLCARGWEVELLLLGDGFPGADKAARLHAGTLLAGAAFRGPMIVDGLALGVLPEAAAMAANIGVLIALVHHPLALESGLDALPRRAYKASEREALCHAQGVICTSDATAAILRSDYGVPRERLFVARPGTDQFCFATGSGGAPSLLSVGAISPRKGFDRLVRALVRHIDLDWHLTIVGDDSRSPGCASALRAEIDRLGLGARVSLTGAVSPERLVAYYGAADAFVLLSQFEGYGMAYAEAVAHGLPVLGTDTDAIRSVVPADAAYLVAPDDDLGLHDALRRPHRG